jgi:hypothetical protein
MIAFQPAETFVHSAKWSQARFGTFRTWGDVRFESAMHEGNAAVRIGKWKLVRKYPGPWELYDLAAQHPERVRDMSERYHNSAKRCGVIPREKILELMKAEGGTAFWEEEKQG